MKRFIVNVLAMSLAMTLWTPRIATAQTTYTWSDISGQLTERTNRPIWAVAHAGNYWFYTDGQDLWNGGQVYRYDGTTQVNITTDVRNAGLTRVDDIVSDGQSALFLKNVVRLDNSFEILKWNSSGYAGVGSYVRNSFASDEGISSLSGRNGTWYIVSTKGRVFTWNGDRSNASQISLPSGVAGSLSINQSTMLYNVNNGSPGSGASRLTLAVAPVANNQWLLLAYTTAGSYKSYRYDGATFTEVTGTLPSMYEVTKVASNGTTAFIAHNAYQSSGDKGQYVTFNGTSVTQTTNAPVNLQHAIVTSNGVSWMIVNGKALERFDGTTVQYLENSRDYLISAAGDMNGHFLIGGAVSDLDTSAPTNPLTAKLLWVTEGELASTGNTVTTGGSFGGDRTYTSANGPKVIAQGDPSGFRVGNGKEFTYRVTASDADGVDRTDLYVNDARIKTCYSDVCEFRTTYWTNGATTKSVKFWVRSTDKRGYSTDTSATPDTLTVDVNSTATAGGTVTTTPATSGTTNTTGSGTAVTDSGTGISSWTWLDPTGKTTLNAGETVTFNVGAYDENGIKRVEIYVNGATKKTCELGNAKGNQTCGVPIYANDYPVGTGIYVNAKITDGADKYTYSTATTLWRNTESGTVTTNGTTASNAVSAWNWYEPSGDLKRGSTTTFRSGAWAQDGLTSIDLYVYGVLKRTCSFNRAYGNQECSVLVYSNDFPIGTTVAANTKATDADGKTAWGELKYVTVTDATTVSGGTSGTNNNPVVWDWIEIGNNFITVDEKAKYVVGAWDENGVSTVTIYVNGAAKQTCSLGTAYGNQKCSYEIPGWSYPAGTTVFVNAKATDATGKEAWTTGKTFKVMGSGTTTSADYANNGSVNSWTNKATYAPTENLYVYGNGSDPDGVNRVEIFVNGERVKTCSYTGTKNATCEATVGPFPNLKAATYAVTVFDRYGYETTTGYKQVAIVK
ncbi:MAG TPA: Ig-like domain-containing protein [Candidatus Methylomirabilis sp.]|nr:Ig-like domain-containing protein [Candidatus Methylomirabilis sp.]